MNPIIKQAINFFFYETSKIFILLISIIFIVSFLRSYLQADKIKEFLSKKHTIVGNILASIIGTITPFCSCSAIPLFIGFLQAGIPLGITFSYLIAAPMVNEIAFVLLLSSFGGKIALLYWAVGIFLAISIGFLLGKLNLEKYVEDFVWQIKTKNTQTETLEQLSLKQRAINAFFYTKELVKSIFIWIILGVAIGAFIHGFVPQELILKYCSKDNPFAVFWAVLIGVPIYANAAGSVPIINALVQKGLPIGTALALMMSITALSLPEIMILRRVLKPKLLFIYVGIVSCGILLVGYLFNLLKLN